jgi:DNA-directed RNA polymerase subunit H (RpoH/RPB5)
MEAWLMARGYRLVPPEFVCIPGYELPQHQQILLRSLPSLEEAHQGPQSEKRPSTEADTDDEEVVLHPEKVAFCPLVDVSVPYIIDTRCNNTASVRVVQRTNGQQMFVIVRNLTDVKLVKKDLFSLCTEFVTFADTVLFSSRLPPEAAHTCLEKAKQCGHSLELLHIPEIRYDKLRNPKVSKTILLDEADIRVVEKRYLRSRTKFPKIHATGAIPRYLNLRPGQVVFEPPKTWRIIVP